MSTAGKVLTVLILLMMMVWLVFVSGVTQLNVNWAQKIAQQEKQLQTLQADTEKAARDIIQITEQARLQRDATERDLREISGRIATLERRQSDSIEKLSRLKVQVRDAQGSAERSVVNKTTREAEFVKAQADLATKKEENARALTLNGELRDQLAKLQDEFKRLLAENAAKLEQAGRDGSISRPTSSRRTSPAS